LKSEKYHQCSLEIASLYNDLRMLKKDTISLEIEESIRAISKRYEEILFKYENHISIDFKMFKTEKPVYHKLSNTEIITIRLKHYFQVRFIYHFFIFFTNNSFYCFLN
jgi:hypothetical protein